MPISRTRAARCRFDDGQNHIPRSTKRQGCSRIGKADHLGIARNLVAHRAATAAGIRRTTEHNPLRIGTDGIRTLDFRCRGREKAGIKQREADATPMLIVLPDIEAVVIEVAGQSEGIGVFDAGKVIFVDGGFVAAHVDFAVGCQLQLCQRRRNCH